MKKWKILEKEIKRKRNEEYGGKRKEERITMKVESLPAARKRSSRFSRIRFLQ